MIDRSAAVLRLSEFLSVASHEMKTPLAGIKAYVELLTDGDADDEATRQEFLDGISSQAKRLERKIDELLEMARCLGESDERQSFIVRR